MARRKTYAVRFVVEGSEVDPEDETGFDAFEESLERLLDAGTLQDAIIADIEDHECVTFSIVSSVSTRVDTEAEGRLRNAAQALLDAGKTLRRTVPDLAKESTPGVARWLTARAEVRDLLGRNDDGEA
jgi:hypothetical protein